MTERLTFIFQPGVQDIFNHFTALFDIRIAYFAPDGSELKVGMAKPWCEYCRLVRQVLGDETWCLVMDRDRREEAAGKRHLVKYRCHAGLTEAIKPLWFDDTLHGFIMIGQIRTNLVLPPEKLRRWAEGVADPAVGWQPEALREAFEAIPLIGPDRFQHIISLFSTLVDYVVQQHFVAVRGYQRTGVLTDWLRQHYMEATTLDDAAELVGLSSFRLAHLLREEQGALTALAFLDDAGVELDASGLRDLEIHGSEAGQQRFGLEAIGMALTVLTPLVGGGMQGRLALPDHGGVHE